MTMKKKETMSLFKNMISHPIQTIRSRSGGFRCCRHRCKAGNKKTKGKEMYRTDDYDTALSSLMPGRAATIREIGCEGDIRRRLLDLGFIPGTSVLCVLRQARGESAAYLIRGTTIALRKEDAKLIWTK